MTERFLIASNGDSLARLAAELFCGWVWEAIGKSAGQVARVAISGGSTPRAMNRELATMDVPWGKIELFWVDERAVPPTSDRSNYGAAKADLFGKLKKPPRGLFAMPGAATDLDAAARGYESAIARTFGMPASDAASAKYPSFDLVMLGIGDDGHTASLFPGDATVDVTDRWVIPVPAAEGREARLTLTRPVITAAKRVVVLAQGEKKKGPIGLARKAGALREIPSRLVQEVKGELVWLVDAAAVEAAAG